MQPKSSGIITLTTDFGAADSYVGAMKGVLVTIAPSARIVDISNEIPPQNIERGAWVLAEAAPYFPDGTVHIGVVDPGVGSERRAIAIATERAFFVGPDNGLLASAVKTLGAIVKVVELTNAQFRLPQASSTFHGRDIFAPAAAHLAMGGAINGFGESLSEIVALDLAMPTRRDHEIEGRVVYVDRFGNLITNIFASDVGPSARAIVGTDDLGPIATTYASVAMGQAVAIVGSNGRVEIAVRDGSALARFGDSPVVVVRW
ncbi:MAG: SAM-dependent chlorinase/fluorinase [Deltaproteobacteria bacterium]|nr:SAM-dependent chlorinase/fluorinase [Deltaproteobacteria bacterium]